jgi:hypothetical protein
MVQIHTLYIIEREWIEQNNFQRTVYQKLK